MRYFQKTWDHIDADEEECVTGETIATVNEEIIDIDGEEPKRWCVGPSIPGRRPITKRKNNSNDISALFVIQSLKSKDGSNWNQSSEEIVIVFLNIKRTYASRWTPQSD